MPDLCLDRMARADCSDAMVIDFDSMFADSPVLRAHLPMLHPRRSDRSKLLHRSFESGSLNIAAGEAPPRLQRGATLEVILQRR